MPSASSYWLNNYIDITLLCVRTRNENLKILNTNMTSKASTVIEFVAISLYIPKRGAKQEISEIVDKNIPPYHAKLT